MTLERIQFVGACNPPTDPGRKPLSQRFVDNDSCRLRGVNMTSRGVNMTSRVVLVT